MRGVPDLLSRPLLRRQEPAWGSRVPWFAGALAAGWVLIATFALAIIPAMAVWIAGGADGALTDPLRFGARTWLLTHRAGVDVDGATIVFAPFGLTLVAVLLMYRSARWAAHQAGTATPRGMLAVAGPAAVVYASGAILLTVFAAGDDVSATPAVGAAIAGAWATVAFTAGVLHETGFDELWYSRLSVEVKAALAGASAAIAGLLVVGAVLTVLAVVLNSGQIGTLATAVDAGPLGNTVLAAGGAAVTPNLVVWGTAFALGPGFSVGTETVVAPGGVELGMLPAIPALGALPADLPDGVAWAALAGPVAVGVVAGLLVHRRLVAETGEPLSTVVLASGGAAAATAIAVSALAGLSGGSLGGQRLSQLGPVPWEVAAMAFLLVGVPAMITAALMSWRAARADSRSGSDRAEETTG